MKNNDQNTVIGMIRDENIEFQCDYLKELDKSRERGHFNAYMQ